MSKKFLLHFVHEHLAFRWTEFLAVTSKNGCKFELISSPHHISTRPFIIIQAEDAQDVKSLAKSASESYLLKGIYELWAQSDQSIDDLAAKAGECDQFLSGIYTKPDQSFRVNCESFGVKLSQAVKVDWIRRMVFMNRFESQANLSNPRQVYCIFEMNERPADGGSLVKEYYFGRLVTSSDRDVINKFSLKERTFIANTTMDPMLSLVATNAARVRPNDIVYDPFVGSGGLLVAAAYKGAYVLGSDIDWLLLHGKSRPSRKGQAVRLTGESVRANLTQYDLQDRYIDIMVSDITRSPLSETFVVDSVISDPPYGVRECSEKIGARRTPLPDKEHKVRYPSKTNYGMQELLSDLLGLSVRHLCIGGRLVYFLPVTKSGRSDKDFIPTHPCLELISYCEQCLTGITARLMVVMEKTRHSKAGDEVHIPSMINEMNFRETYFSKSSNGNKRA